MSEHRRYRDMTDEGLETAIRGLPRREPRASLRERILSHPIAPTPRRISAFRPAFALPALVVLLLADWLVLRSQSSGTLYSPSPQAAVAQGGPASREEIGLMRDLAASGLPLRLAMRHPSLQPETYLELRNRMLNEADGG